MAAAGRTAGGATPAPRGPPLFVQKRRGGRAPPQLGWEGGGGGGGGGGPQAADYTAAPGARPPAPHTSTAASRPGDQAHGARGEA